MLIIHNSGNGSVISVGIAPSQRLDGETDGDFAARMVATHVPTGAQYLVNPTLPDGVPIDQLSIDWVSGVITLAPAHLNAKKAEKIAAAWAEHNARFHSYEVQVDVGGQARPYRCDNVTRENVMAIVTAINTNAALVPNPRPFTPSGEITPVDTTHAEFQTIYLAGLAAGDAHFKAYAVHKSAISALTDVADVMAYDVTTGWPT